VIRSPNPLRRPKTGPDPREKARRMLMLVALAFGVWFILRGVTGLLVPPVPDHPVQEVRMRVIAHRGGKGGIPRKHPLRLSLGGGHGGRCHRDGCAPEL
jgi:hypothetical protein